MSMISRARVSLGFCGEDLEPEELTDILGAPPSIARRKADRRTLRSGETHAARQGSWIIEYSQEPSPIEIDEQINALLDKLTNETSVWLDLTNRYRARVFCGLFLDNWNEGFSLTESTLKRLSARNLPADFDIYAPTDTWYEDQAESTERG
jgi:hypothetical protein